MGVNLVLSVVGGLGVLAAYLALTSLGRARIRYRDQMGEVEGPIALAQRWADQAGVPVSGAEIVRFSAVLGLLGALIGYLLTSSVIGALFGGVVGGYAYFAFLLDRRDRRRRLYREALADVASLVAEGMEEGGTLQAGLERAVQYGPPVCRSDMEEILSGIRSGLPVGEAAAGVQKRVRDSMLDALVQIFAFGQEHSRALPMVQGMADSLRRESEFWARVDAEMAVPKATLYLLLFMPVGVILFLRMMVPEYALFWRSATGGVLLAVSFGLIAAGYILGSRIISSAVGVPEAARVKEISEETGAPRWPSTS